MSLAQRFERRLESLVGGAFARVFKGQVEPVEIGQALQREASDKRNVLGHGRVLCPNRYRVTLSPSDHDRLAPWESQLTNSLAELVQEHLDENGWSSIGDIEVYLARDESLHTGVFGVASRMDSQAPPRQRPFDSLSLPVIPGRSPGDYADPRAADPRGADPRGADPRGGAAIGAAAPAYAPPVPPQPSYQQPGHQNQQPGPPQHWAPPESQGQATRYEPAAYDQRQYEQRYRQPVPAIVVEGSDHRLDLRPGSNLIGRGSDADLQLNDQGVSRRHLDVQFDGHVATAYDLGSTNGTAVNGHLVGSHVLRHGDVIRLGHTRLIYVQDGS